MSERRRSTVRRPAPQQAERRKTGERRESPRTPTTLWVGIDEKGISAGKYDGDIGLNGASFFTNVEYAAGQNLDVEFELPGIDHDFKVRSRVVDARKETAGFAVGVKFLDLDFEEERLLARFLDERNNRKD